MADARTDIPAPAAEIAAAPTDSRSTLPAQRSTLPAQGRWTANGAKNDPSAVHHVRILGVDREVAVSGRAEERIAAVAARQRGRISRRQLRAVGITRWAIRNRVARGRLLALEGGVFALGGPMPVELGNEAAALLAAGPHAALSHHSAAVLWDMQLPRHGDGAVHVLLPDGRARSLGSVRIHRSRNLAPQDIRIRHGLPVTSPARTLLDQAERLSPRALELDFDRALVSRIVTPTEVMELLRRTSGRAGGPILRALVEHQRGPTLTRSQAEERFLALVRAGGLPPPRVNARVHGYEVDFLWPDQRLVVEIDGFRYHATRRAFEHDHRKDAALRSLDLEVLRFTYHQLGSEAMVVLAQVARRF